jgi:acetophenone carboxylase
MYNVDIDTGGTMTDGLVSGAGKVLSLKVETTPHDVTVSFFDVIGAARDALGYADLRSFLADVDVIRWSSTITSNVLAQRVGPKIGLLVSHGHESDLYDQPTADAVIGSIIDADDIVGIPKDANETEVRRAIKDLLDKGIRRINVSLSGAFPDSSAEQRIVDTISEDYPDHFLGSIPALAGSDVALRPDDATRTVASLINAYVHPSLATTLYRAEEILREEHGWPGNVLIGHINGGVARIGKTKAFDTIESGPLFGTYACAATSEQLGDQKVIAIDVGGTTAKASAVGGGTVVTKQEGDFFDIPLQLEFPLLRSIALGGGSVARVADGRVVIGPDSMGAAPGPAAYGLGGRNATVTDAFVVSGFLSPTSFLNGARTLDIERARAAIQRHVGDPLGLDVDEAARAILDQAWDDVAQLARETAEEAGWDPTETTVYAYGGNGPLFVTAVAERLGAKTARFFRFGNVYSAYGSAISDVVHLYETVITPDLDLRTVGDDLADQARRDLRGEGFDPATATFSWQLRTDADEFDSGTLAGGEDLLEGLATLVARAAGVPTLLRLRATSELPSVVLPPLDAAGEPGLAGARSSRFGADGRLPVYSAATLAGSTLSGPLVVDGDSTTWLVGNGWDISVGAHGDAELARTGAGS